MQELTNILEFLESQRASGGSGARDDAAPDDGPAEDAEEEAEAAKEGRKKAGLLQTFVFSATLALPQGLRKRLRRGAAPPEPLPDMPRRASQQPWRMHPRVMSAPSPLSPLHARALPCCCTL